MNILAAFAFSWGLFFFNPLSVFLSNSSHYKTQTNKIASRLALIATAFTLFFYGISLLFISYPQGQEIYWLVIQILALGVFLNGQIFTSACAEEGGRKIDWVKFPAFSLMTLLGVGAVIGICVFATRFPLGRILLPVFELSLYLLSLLSSRKNVRHINITIIQ